MLYLKPVIFIAGFFMRTVKNKSFKYTHSETRGIIVLLIICTLLIGINIIIRQWQPDEALLNEAIARQIKTYTNSPIKKININTADSATLARLKGIGPATAQNIITYRNEHGEFKTIYELDSVRGIGLKTIAAIDSFIDIKNLPAK